MVPSTHTMPDGSSLDDAMDGVARERDRRPPRPSPNPGPVPGPTRPSTYVRPIRS